MFLDLDSIRAELVAEAPAGKTVTLVRDLKNGRAMHSLALLISLGNFEGVSLCYVSPQEPRMHNYIQEQVSKTTSGALEHQEKEDEDFAVASKTADFVCMTHVEKDRLEREADYDKRTYVLTSAILKAHAKEKMAVLHPLPRVNEIAIDCDVDSRAAYFWQMKIGKYVRMAVPGLHWVCTRCNREGRGKERGGRCRRRCIHRQIWQACCRGSNPYLLARLRTGLVRISADKRINEFEAFAKSRSSTNCRPSPQRHGQEGPA